MGELTGAPFAVGAANVYRVVPGSAPVVHLSGFTTIIDLAFAPNGDLYVLEHTTGGVLTGAGRLTRVTPGGARTPVLDGLTRPTSVLIDDDGVIYISNKGTSVGTGEVLRIEL